MPFAKLTKDWMLRGWSDAPAVAVNWATGEQVELKTAAFYVAEYCDGRTDFASLAFLPEHDALLRKLIDSGIAAECQEGDTIEDWQRYRRATNPRLTGIHWCVTGRCNLNCRHCYMESPAERYGHLPFADMVRLVEQFERANVLEVVITGGEPFLRKDLLRLFELLALKRIRVSEIYSNGLPITDKHMDGLRKLGVSPVFQISYDGLGHHDQMRGKQGIESRVIDAIRRLRCRGFEVAVATSVDRLNIGQLGETYDLMKRLGVQAWTVAPPVELGNWRGTATAASLEELADAYAPLLKRWLEDGRPFSLHLAPVFRGRQGRAETGVEADLRTARRFTPESYDCGVCREQPNLLPDGTLLPCPGYVDSILHQEMPNLLQEELSSVWARSLLRTLAETKKKDLLAANPECVSCELFEDCGLGCRAAALRETGRLMAKDPSVCALWTQGYKRRFQELAAVAARTSQSAEAAQQAPMAGG